jgi:hypothetical protein
VTTFGRNCLRPLAVAALSVLPLLFFGQLSPVNTPTALANHANGHLSDGIGFEYLAPNEYGFLPIYVHPEVGSIGRDAVSDWNSRGLQYLVRHLVVPAMNPSYALAEVRWKWQPSSFGDDYTQRCAEFFSNPKNSDYYAAIFVKDVGGSWRNVDGSGFWQQRPGYPFYRASICLNSDWPINKGHVAHELGHALGLDHPTASGQPCGETYKDSIMAYNYQVWMPQWPSDLKPTREDVIGRWVCNLSYPAGLDYIYQYTTTPGWGNPANIDVRVGYMNGTLNPVRNNGADPVKYGMTIVNFSNVTVYDVKAVIYARNGERYEVRTASSLSSGASTPFGYTPSLTYGGWADGAVDWVSFHGEYYVTPKSRNGVTQYVTGESLWEHVVTNLGHTRVQFMETNVNPVSPNAPATFKIKVCNVLYAGPAWVRPVIYSDGGRHNRSWEYLSFLECTQVRDYVEYYGWTGIDWVGFAAERYGAGTVPYEYLLEQIR